jgi:hypothetical protein
MGMRIKINGTRHSERSEESLDALRSFTSFRMTKEKGKHMRNKIITKISTGLLMLALLIAPQLSYADWGVGIHVGDRDRDQHFYRWHDHPGLGLRVHILPVGYLTVRVGGARYYYYDGLYYNNVGGEYVLVSPPVGAFVKVIPSDFHVIIINGKTYYTDNGVYYILTRRHGYKVVAAPVIYAQPVRVVYGR